MRTVTHRELRNHSAELLRAVEAGEAVVVTNRGKPVAVVSPYLEGQTSIERLRAAGQTRPAQRPLDALRGVTRRRSKLSSGEILRDVRGEW